MRHLKIFLVAISILLSSSARAADAFDRLMDDVRSTPKWNAARTAGEKMWAIRAVAGGYDVVSDPVSDRYLITRYGGPIDLVHFFGLAAMVCEGRESNDVLLDQWTKEGGPDFEAKRTRTYWTEAHPDDLPSNALGALFGEEVRPRNKDASFPLVDELRKFFDSLSPFPNRKVKRYSHAEVVMGLRGTETLREKRRRSEWFTALPLFVVPVIEPERVTEIRNSREGLTFAGLEIYQIEGRPIGVRRTDHDKH